MEKNIFCVDIGGSKLICGVITRRGEILGTYRADYPKDYTFDTIVGFIKEGFGKLSHFGPASCGVAVPGLCDYEKGIWLYSPFSGLSDIPINRIISDITSLPTVCDNDVNVSAVAEKYFGLCRNKDDFLWITVSNGIGGGLYLNGKVYRGESCTAGEIGHFIVEENGRKCCCGNNGCLEAYASGASLSQIFKERTGKDMSAKDIAELARKGDKTALDVWEEAGAYIGKAVSYAVNLLGIDTVVLGGGAAEAFDLIYSSAQAALEHLIFKKANSNAKILHSKPGSKAALMGCAGLVLEKGELV